MKKLSKIKLQNAVVLENQEMKVIFGGSGTNSSSCSGGGINNSTCSGLCPPVYIYQNGTLREKLPRKTCTPISISSGAGLGPFTFCDCI